MVDVQCVMISTAETACILYQWPILPIIHPVEVAVKNLNEVLSEDDPAQTLKALKNPDGNFPFIYQEASRYHKALLKERKEGLPATILVSGFLDWSLYVRISSLGPQATP